MRACPETPPVNRITHTCKNITLATTSLRPVIISLPSSMLSTSVNGNNKKLEMEVSMTDILFLVRINT